MDHREFLKCVPLLLMSENFEIRSSAVGTSGPEGEFHCIDLGSLHLILCHADRPDERLWLPYCLIEFVNPGVLVLCRNVSIYKGGFV